MPFITRCPHCQAEHQLADGLRGKRLRCPECHEPFSIREEKRIERVQAGRSSANAPLSRSSRRPEEEYEEDYEDDYEDEDYQQSSGSSKGLLIGLAIGGVLLLLLLLGGGIAVAWMLSVNRTTTAQPPVASTTTQPDQQAGDRPMGPARPNPPQGPQQPPVLPGRPPAPLGNQADPPIVWSVQPDPLVPAIPAIRNAQAQIPVPSSIHNALFPTTPSPMVALGTNTSDRDGRVIWNLADMTKVGELRGKISTSDPVLSPDGKYLAAEVRLKTPPTVQVISTRDQMVHEVIVDDKRTRPQFLDFAGEDRLVTVKWTFTTDFTGTIIQVWNFRTGQPVTEIRRKHHFKGDKYTAMSPGRRYLATIVTDGADRGIVIYDLVQGKPAGRIQANVGSGSPVLAFSPDGQSLALMTRSSQGSSIYHWNLSDGKLKKEHRFPRDLRRLTTWNTYALPFQWIADSSGWVVYSQLLIDAESGQLFYQVPLQRVNSPYPLRMIDDQHILFSVSQGGKRALGWLTLPKQQLVASRQKVREQAASANQAIVPAITGKEEGDWSTVKTLPAPTGSVAWQATPDATPAAKQPLGSRPLVLGDQNTEVLRTLFASPDVGQVVVLGLSATSALSNSKTLKHARFDLSTGQLLSQGDMGSIATPTNQRLTLIADMSPDAKLCAIVKPEEAQQVEVWSLEENKLLRRWSPYAKEAKKKVTWLGAIDDKHLLTLGDGGKLTLWQMPEARAIYTSPAHGDRAFLSPTGKYVVAGNGASYDVLEAKTGERRGQLSLPEAQVVLRTGGGAFLPDSSQVAILAQGTRSQLVWWDFNTGESKGVIEILPYLSEMQWLTEEYVLVGNTLVDLKLGWPLLRYPQLRQGQSGGSAERWWFVQNNATNTPPVLIPTVMPGLEVRQFRTLVDRGQIQALFVPGMTVQIQSQGLEPQHQQRLHSSLESTLTARGLKVEGQGAQATLQVTFSVKPTGKTLSYRPLGTGNREEIKVPEKQVDWRWELRSPRAGTLWSKTGSAKTSNPSLVSGVKEEVQVHLEKQLWDTVLHRAGNLNLPTFLVRGPRGVMELPRTVTPSSGSRR
jgi:WD40 repeat protein